MTITSVKELNTINDLVKVNDENLLNDVTSIILDTLNLNHDYSFFDLLKSIGLKNKEHTKQSTSLLSQDEYAFLYEYKMYRNCHLNDLIRSAPKPYLHKSLHSEMKRYLKTVQIKTSNNAKIKNLIFALSSHSNTFNELLSPLPVNLQKEIYPYFIIEKNFVSWTPPKLVKYTAHQHKPAIDLIQEKCLDNLLGN